MNTKLARILEVKSLSSALPKSCVSAARPHGSYLQAELIDAGNRVFPGFCHFVKVIRRATMLFRYCCWQDSSASKFCIDGALFRDHDFASCTPTLIALGKNPDFNARFWIEHTSIILTRIVRWSEEQKLTRLALIIIPSLP